MTKTIALKNTFKRRPRSNPKALSRVDKYQNREITRLKRIVNTRERKFFDQVGTALQPNWTGSLTNFINIAQGDTDVSRTGDKISIERIEARFNGGMTAAGSNQVRLMLIRDKGNSITSVGQVLDSTALNTVNAAQGPYEEDTRENFEVLMDRTFMLDNVTNYQFQTRYSKTYRKGKPVLFNNNSTTVNKGQIKLLLISDLLAPNVALDYYVRVWFTDL